VRCEKNEAKQWTNWTAMCALVAGSQCIMETEVEAFVLWSSASFFIIKLPRTWGHPQHNREADTHTQRRLPDSQCPERLYREQLPPAIIPLSKVQALFYSLQAKCYRHSSVWQYQKPSLTCAENWYRDHFWTYSYIYNLHLQNDHSGLQELLK